MKTFWRRTVESEEILTVISRPVYMPFLHFQKQPTNQVSKHHGVFAGLWETGSRPWFDRAHNIAQVNRGPYADSVFISADTPFGPNSVAFSDFRRVIDCRAPSSRAN